MRNRKEYKRDRITIQHSARFTELKSYTNYLAEKKRIQDKYPSKPWDLHEQGQGNHKNPFEQEWWDDWTLYKQDMLELLFRPNGNFQQFFWDITPEKVELEVDVYMRGRYNSNGYKNKKQNE